MISVKGNRRPSSYSTTMTAWNSGSRTLVWSVVIFSIAEVAWSRRLSGSHSSSLTSAVARFPDLGIWVFNFKERMEIDPTSLCRLHCVILPCLVKSPARSVEFLGGEASLKAALINKTESIECTMPGTLPSSTLTSSKVVKKGVLVSMRRKKRAGPDDPMEIKVIGVVEHAHTFQNPFDFQVSPTLPAL